MAEHGIKTFPLTSDPNGELKWIEREFGLKGFGIAIKLLQAIANHGYYMKWDIDAQLSFVDDYRLSSDGLGLVSEVVACCLRREVFDAGLFEKYKILTNSSAQETFLTANKRKNEVRFVEEYALPIVYRFIENVSKNGGNVNILFKNVNNSDLNQIKPNQTKSKKTKSDHHPPATLKPKADNQQKRKVVEVDEDDDTDKSAVEFYLENIESRVNEMPYEGKQDFGIRLLDICKRIAKTKQHVISRTTYTAAEILKEYVSLFRQDGILQNAFGALDNEIAKGVIKNTFAYTVATLYNAATHRG